MKVEHQGYNECALATLAALGGVSLDFVRDLALQYANAVSNRQINTWSFAIITFGRSSRYTRTIEQIAAALGVRVEAEKLAYTLYTPTTGTPGLPSSGRGFIVVYSDVGSAHAMPWFAGLVYDSMDTEPIQGQTLSGWLASHPGWHVERIETV